MVTKGIITIITDISKHSLLKKYSKWYFTFCTFSCRALSQTDLVELSDQQTHINALCVQDEKFDRFVPQLGMSIATQHLETTLQIIYFLNITAKSIRIYFCDKELL